MSLIFNLEDMLFRKYEAYRGFKNGLRTFVKNFPHDISRSEY